MTNGVARALARLALRREGIFVGSARRLPPASSRLERAAAQGRDRRRQAGLVAADDPDGIELPDFAAQPQAAAPKSTPGRA